MGSWYRILFAVAQGRSMWVNKRAREFWCGAWRIPGLRGSYGLEGWGVFGPAGCGAKKAQGGRKTGELDDGELVCE